jgi:hypothetical protein
MALSLHDNLLVSYEVQCEARTITLRTEYRTPNRPAEVVTVTGVQGYRFENDAFGNVIFDIEVVRVEEFLKAYGPEISESDRIAGSPGPWAANLAAAHGYLREQGVQGFCLNSSHGLSSWVLARECLFPKFNAA